MRRPNDGEVVDEEGEHFDAVGGGFDVGGELPLGEVGFEAVEGHVEGGFELVGERAVVERREVQPDRRLQGHPLVEVGWRLAFGPGETVEEEGLLEDTFDGGFEAVGTVERELEPVVGSNQRGITGNDARAEVVRQRCDHEHRVKLVRDLNRDPRLRGLQPREVERPHRARRSEDGLGEWDRSVRNSSF